MSTLAAPPGNAPPELLPAAGQADRADDWLAQAACHTGNSGITALFFSEELADIAAARAICAGCPVATPCLEAALARREPWGVWGGQVLRNGRILATKRRPGRPRAVPLDTDELAPAPVPVHLRGYLRSA